MYASLIASDAHTEWRRSLAIAAVHPELNLRKPAYEEGEDRGPLQRVIKLIEFFAKLLLSASSCQQSSENIVS
jgi:hypothetical protein